MYQVVSDASEDVFDEADTLEEAVRLARVLVAGRPSGEPVLVTLGGRVLRQLQLTPGGLVVEETVGEVAGRSASV
jgi:hypothetical protein